MPAARVIVTDLSQLASGSAAACIGGVCQEHAGRCCWCICFFVGDRHVIDGGRVELPQALLVRRSRQPPPPC
jgi:hypothetical protein